MTTLRTRRFASRAELDTIVERFASAIDAAVMAMKRAA